jgi:Tfp pilus assembly protein PilF
MRYVTLALSALVLVSCNRNPDYLKQRNLARGNEYFKAGKLKEASIMYRNAITNDRKFGEAYYRLALTELKQNGSMSAVRQLRIAVELLPGGTDDWKDAILKLAEIEVAGAAC